MTPKEITDKAESIIEQLKNEESYQLDEIFLILGEAYKMSHRTIIKRDILINQKRNKKDA